ncbi:MAG: DUF501 domain-containing protein, partial [Bifidobacteriaceae bacterium]|nr:DUF501 domain-containing protein [Bifidobacteriaceae bacterium]
MLKNKSCQPNLSFCQKDFTIIANSLKRIPRAVIDVVTRCVCKNPIVVRCWPFLSDKTPFPTHYYLVSNDYIKNISALESQGLMVKLNQMLKTNKQFSQQYLQAHKSYIKDREKFAAVDEIANFSAGGMPTYIKCLHSHLAHSLAKLSLAKQSGINPVGDYLLANYEQFNIKKCRCTIPYNKAFLRRAVIDCGTNTIRLLIADAYKFKLNKQLPKIYLKDVIPRKMEINRLGLNLNKTGLLDKSSLNKTFSVCRNYKKLIDQYHVEQVIFVATSASRDAKNSGELVQGVEEILQVKPYIIDGQTEALYSYLGVISSVNFSSIKDSGLSVIIDIGGGSTEIAIGVNGLINGLSAQNKLANMLKVTYSMPIGAVRLAELFFNKLPPSQTQQNQAIEFINQQIDKAFEKLFAKNIAKSLYKTGEKIRVYGVAGTVTNITAKALNLPYYNSEVIDKTKLDLEQIFSNIDSLVNKSY